MELEGRKRSMLTTTLAVFLGILSFLALCWLCSWCCCSSSSSSDWKGLPVFLAFLNFCDLAPEPAAELVLSLRLCVSPSSRLTYYILTLPSPFFPTHSPMNPHPAIPIPLLGRHQTLLRVRSPFIEEIKLPISGLDEAVGVDLPPQVRRGEAQI